MHVKTFQDKTCFSMLMAVYQFMLAPICTGISSTTKIKRAEFVNSLIFDKVLFVLSFYKMCERVFNAETPRVSLRNCCHHRHITLYAKPPYSVKTMRLAQYAQTAPLSHILRFIPFFVTSKPQSPHGLSSETDRRSIHYPRGTRGE